MRENNMKKTILAFLIALFSIGNVWADDNDTEKNNTAKERSGILCGGHWTKVNGKPLLSFGRQWGGAGSLWYCQKDINIDLKPIGNNNDVIIDRGRERPESINLLPGGMQFEPTPGDIVGKKRQANIGYVIDFPEDNKYKGDTNFEFIPQFRFEFQSKPITGPEAGRYKPYLVFESPGNENIGVIYDVQVGRGGGEWKPVENTTEIVEGGHWVNTYNTNRRQRWYYASIRAQYVLLNPIKSLGQDIIINGSRYAIAKAYFQAKGNGITIEDNKGTTLSMNYYSVTVHQNVTTCRMDEFTRGQTTVRLNKGIIPQINPEAYAGTFRLDLFCNNHRKTPPKIFMTFSAATQGGINANHGEDLLEIEKGDNKATGVALRIKNKQTGEVVRFGPQSRAPGNIGQFQLPQNPVTGASIENNFDVYYVKTGNEIKGGKVKAKATFTFSYQ